MQTILSTIIVSCPLCGNEHRYDLQIQRTKVVMFNQKKITANKYTHLFTCPQEKEVFQSVIEFDEDADWQIYGIQVQKK